MHSWIDGAAPQSSHQVVSSKYVIVERQEADGTNAHV